MDNLARDAILARQAKMSYGKYKAIQPFIKPEEIELPEGWRRCVVCGKPFKERGVKRFCEIGCRNKAYEERARIIRAESTKRWKERKKANENDGKD